MLRKLLFCLLFLGGFMVLSFSQSLPSDWKDQWEALGIEESEIVAKLAEKGIDVNQIDPNNLAEVQSSLEEVIAELQAEKIQQQATTLTPLSAQVKADSLVEPPSSGKADEQTVVPDSSVSTWVSPDTGSWPDSTIPAPKIYGQQLFRGQDFKLQLDPQNVKPTDSYVLGPGDELSIAVFGASQATFHFTISQDGYIQPPGMGRLYLKGMKLGQARKLLRKQFGRYYSFGEGEFALSLTYSRVITVHIVGEVLKPGSYSLTAGNTIFHALLAAGGPTDLGSLRQIRLLREGEEARVFDVYAFLEDPLTERDFFLENNDYIHVPVSGKLVKIEGAVKRPGTYEMAEGEDLATLIRLAGGLGENAYKKSAQITRYSSDSQEVIDIDLEQVLQQSKRIDLFDGDLISIRFIEKPAENYVSISGRVQFPGQYQWFKGMRITDLVERGGLERESRRDLAYVFRSLPDERVQLLRVDLAKALQKPDDEANIFLKPKDNLQIFSLTAFADKATLSTEGAVRNPIAISFDPHRNTRVSDLILLSDGLLPNAAEYAYIKRLNWRNKKDINYIRFNLKEALSDTASLENHVLQPFDHIIVYTNEQFADETHVSISGAVRTAGSFDYDSGLRVSDLVYFANGLKPDAADIAFITRTDPATKQISYVQVDLKKALQERAGPADVLLLPLDEIQVPSKADFMDERTVEVQGAVRQAGTYQYHEGMTLQEVLLLSGGLKFKAAHDRIEISRLIVHDNRETESLILTLTIDDSLHVQNHTGPFYLQPYDKVFVRSKPEFSFQKTVVLEGEVRYPGMYALQNSGERLSSLLARAGGLTDKAFPEGATLFRAQDSVGYVIMDLEKALSKPKSRFNYVLKDGDKIVIPSKQTFVRISGAVKAAELFAGDLYQNGIKVPYRKGKRARYYVKHYAGGKSKEGRYRKTVVVYPSGQAVQAKSWGFLVWTPRVKPGSEIIVGAKVKKEKAEGEKEDSIDWNEVILDSVTQITAILSLVLLVKQLNK